MPRVRLIDPWGLNYEIATRRTESTLLAWFDEILPIVNHAIREPDVPPARINVWPMFNSRGTNPDWLCDSRATSGIYLFPPLTGLDGICELIDLRHRLEQALAKPTAREVIDALNRIQ